MTDLDSTAGSQSVSFPMRKPLLSLMLSLASGSMSTYANAQSTPAEAPSPADAQAKPIKPPAGPASSPAADSQVTQIQTVMVSATRRREPAREVPMQVETLSTEKLEKSGAKT